MKAQFQKILIGGESSFIAKKLDLPVFDSEYHFHPEYELKYVIRSKGKRLVGDSVENFQEGDLVLVGPNIPHYWKNDPVYYDSDGLTASAYLVMFSENCLGGEFFSLPEMAPVKELLYKAKGGIRFPGADSSDIPGKLKYLTTCKGPLRIMMMIDILYELSQAPVCPLINETFIAELPIHSNNHRLAGRLKKVHEFVIVNFQNKINIRDIADLANMTDHAFCRYFKRSTKKTFMTFLSELRVCHSKKLLIETGNSISDICYASGFDNLSNFNRKFKSITGMTPREFRKLYMN
jgi:AraC-like DNA-binding protein